MSCVSLLACMFTFLRVQFVVVKIHHTHVLWIRKGIEIFIGQVPYMFQLCCQSLTAADATQKEEEKESHSLTTWKFYSSLASPVQTGRAYKPDPLSGRVHYDVCRVDARPFTKHMLPKCCIAISWKVCIWEYKLYDTLRQWSNNLFLMIFNL